MSRTYGSMQNYRVKTNRTNAPPIDRSTIVDLHYDKPCETFSSRSAVVRAMSNDELDTGLEHVLVAETRLSKINGSKGALHIGGFSLDELAPNATFEETTYLLRHDRFPTVDELSGIRDELADVRSVPATTLDTLRAAAGGDVPAIDALRMGAAAASLGQAGDDPERDGLVAIAQFPTIIAAYSRLCEGEEPVDPCPDLSHAANYLYMLNNEEPSEAEVRGIETYLNTVVDHGLNASTFTARAITSTESDVISAVTGAVGSLKGPLHGGAPGPVLDMLQEIDNRGDPEGYIENRLEFGERLMGFGHRVYDVRDPRAAVLSTAAEQFYRADGDEAFFELTQEIEETARAVLDEQRPDLDIETNVEFYTAVLLHGIGVPSELFTPTFAVARVAGWTAHCLEQRENSRLIRPQSRYIGETGREWVPVEDR